MSSSIISFKAVSKRYGSLLAADNISFDLERGRLLALLGPSGCGKTTTLRLIAGLETPDRGAIWLDGRCVAGPNIWIPPELRQVGMVFQDFALFPHLTVEDNITFGLSGSPSSERRKRAEALLDLVGLSGLSNRYPHQLSGGQQQRVALARALAPQPNVVLLDEPFSNLDAALRRSMREEVRRILEQVGATSVFVTHDQEEALSMADSIAILQHGRILQLGSPQQVYLAPASRDVALLLGDANFVLGEAQGEAVSCALGLLPLREPFTGRAEVMIRPEAIDLRANENGAAGAVRVTGVQFFGHDQLVQVLLPDGTPLEVRTQPRADLIRGVAVQVQVQGQVMAYPPSS